MIALRRDNGRIVHTRKASGGINGWLAAVGDTMLVIVGATRSPFLLALGLGG